MLELLISPEAWLALLTLTVLEIVLGIDNIIFISVLVDRLPPAQRQRARLLGLGLAMATRILLLLFITRLMGLTTPLFDILGLEISWRDIILGLGGVFLIAKSTVEIHHSLEGPESSQQDTSQTKAAFGAILIQIALIDVVFSLDSVITAVGMVKEVPIMVAAIVLAVGVMLLTAQMVSQFVERHPTVKILALSFLILVGTALVAESLSFHIPKGYIYFAMFFSVTVEMLNIRVRRKQAPAPPVILRKKPIARRIHPLGKAPFE